jgi:hypothetical protein
MAYAAIADMDIGPNAASTADTDQRPAPETHLPTRASLYADLAAVGSDDTGEVVREVVLSCGPDT